MIVELAISSLIVLLAYHLYVYKKNHHHFEKNGLKYKPGIPLFGNTFYSTFAIKHVVEDIDEVYQAYPDERFLGYVEGTKRIIMVKDPELIKLITVKDFDHFVNRKELFAKEIDPLLASSLLQMKDKKWREMRPMLTPAFVSSKLKQMMPLMVHVSNKVLQYLKDHQNQEVDVFDMMTRYNSDVIFSTTFGVVINSFEDTANDFFSFGKKAIDITFWRRVYYFFCTQFPIVAKIMEVLGIQFLPPIGAQFFRKLVCETIEYRKKYKVVSADFMGLLVEASKAWTLDELAGQIYFAFLASFESSSSTLALCIHELAINGDIQEKLYQEIMSHKEIEGLLTYDKISELDYLNCVLNETMRKYSIAMYIDRICTKPYTLPAPREGGKPYQMNPGDLIYNVVNSTHLNPKYFPDPLVFNPDRFSAENRNQIQSFTFMPFGLGPRNCLGMRYSILKMKVLIYQLVLHYWIENTEKTPDPIKIKPHEFHFRAEGGTYVRFRARN